MRYVRYRGHNSLPLVVTMGLIIPAHTFPTYLSEFRFNIFLPTTLEPSKWSYPFSSFQLKSCVYLSLTCLPPAPQSLTNKCIFFGLFVLTTTIPISFSSFLPSMPTITLLNILFSNILCSLTKFHTHTKQTSSYARCGIITAVFVRIQVFQDATPCLVRSQSPERDVFTRGLLQSNLHWIVHFRSPQQPPPPSRVSWLFFPFTY